MPIWRCGRHGELVGELEALVAAHPLRERLRGQLMLALYRSGRQAEALDAYQRARRELLDELGIEPGAELSGSSSAILRRTRRSTPRRDGPRRRPTPAPSGRCSSSRALDGLDALLRPGVTARRGGRRAN